MLCVLLARPPPALARSPGQAQTALGRRTERTEKTDAGRFEMLASFDLT
jgi:hypothetical protein